VVPARGDMLAAEPGEVAEVLGEQRMFRVGRRFEGVVV